MDPWWANLAVPVLGPLSHAPFRWSFAHERRSSRGDMGAFFSELFRRPRQVSNYRILRVSVCVRYSCCRRYARNNLLTPSLPKKGEVVREKKEEKEENNKGREVKMKTMMKICQQSSGRNGDTAS